MNVSVVIPAHNESAAISTVIHAVREHLPGCEILVVDDASTDTTGDVAQEAGAWVFRHPYNMGNGAAVKTGIRMATGDKIVLMDGDGQHDPADIPKMLEAAAQYDMVVGARSPQSHANLLRRYANGLYNVLASYVSRRKIKDLTSGFRVVDRRTVTNYLSLLPNTFSYPATITLSYMRTGRSVCFLPIHAGKRKGKSKIRPVHDGIRFFLIIIKISTLFSPLLIFLPVSFTFFLLGLAYYAFTYLTQHRFTNMSALLFISAVILFMMGLISEQITQLLYDRMDKVVDR